MDSDLPPIGASLAGEIEGVTIGWAWLPTERAITIRGQRQVDDHRDVYVDAGMSDTRPMEALVAMTENVVRYVNNAYEAHKP